MKSIKIVQKFFSESEAKNARSYQKTKAKREKTIVLDVMIVDACELFRKNGWLKKSPFKGIGRPVEGQFMVIVCYNHQVIAVKKTSALKKKIVTASKTRSAASMFSVVRLNEKQKKSAIINYVSSITIPAFRFKYTTDTTIEGFDFNTGTGILRKFNAPLAA